MQVFPGRFMESGTKAIQFGFLTWKIFSNDRQKSFFKYAGLVESTSGNFGIQTSVL
jgi:hypothetical protein